MAKNDIINVFAFGEEIGRIGLNAHENRSSFQYNPEYLGSSNLKELFPLTGIIKRVSQPQLFSNYQNDTFRGLPPQIANSLPDMFGNLIFKTWLASNHKDQEELNILEQLAYISNRGMGALEYYPSKEIPIINTIDLEQIIDILKVV